MEKLLTQEELKKMNDRALELKLLIENECINIKFNPKNNKSRQNLVNYSKELKKIVKTLKKYQKKALENGL